MSDLSPGSALKSIRAANAVAMTNFNARHGIAQASGGRKAPRFLNSPIGKLGKFRTEGGPVPMKRMNTPEAAVLEPAWATKVSLGSAGLTGASVVAIG